MGSVGEATKTKFLVIQNNLQGALESIKALSTEVEQLHIESESYKSQFAAQTLKCESKTCISSECYKKLIKEKDNILQKIGSALTTLNETKNFNIINEIFKILCGDTVSQLSLNKQELKKHGNETCASPKREFISFNDDSTSEIEGTPTGRISPIIQTRKHRITSHTTDSREKKKCSSSWPTPEKKVKLTYTTPSKPKPNSSLKQSRLNLVRVKSTNVVDLTCSPETINLKNVKTEAASNTQIIKKEPIDNNETMLPNDTTEPNTSNKFKEMVFQNLPKWKTPTKVKPEDETIDINMEEDHAHNTEMEDSINLLKPHRFPLATKKSQYKQENMQIKKQETSPNSPKKQPLVENINTTNIPEDCNLESSMSILQNQNIHPPSKYCKRWPPPKLEPIYKEPAPRTKAEKRALPGWSCDECKNFYEELYKDDPAKLLEKMDACSKHRSRQPAPGRRTPPGYWDLRWSPPADTEEFNRKNNAI